jgi:hypothetical protein
MGTKKGIKSNRNCKTFLDGNCVGYEGIEISGILQGASNEGERDWDEFSDLKI